MDEEMGHAGKADAQDEALLWVSRLTSGEAGSDMLASFDRWRNADPRHETALSEARQLWVDLGRPLDSLYAPRLASLSPGKARASSSERSRRTMFFAVAASMLLAAMLAQQWLTNWRYDAVTRVAEQRTVSLEDGSTLWLNSDSAVDVAVDGRQRNVVLERGEAFFDVAHDETRPFVVRAGAGEITVLGTAFGVRRIDDDVVVTVQRGKVQVAGGGSPPVVITADMRVRVHAGDRVKPLQMVNADQELSWRHGRLMFEDRPVSEIFAALRRYDRRIVLLSYPGADQTRINAGVDLARLDEWYIGLQKTLPVSVSTIGPIVWVRRVDRKVAGAPGE